MTPEEILVSLLRAAICGDEIGEELTHACTADALEQVYLLAQRHDLAHLAGFAISKVALPDGEARRQLQQAAALAVFRHTRQAGELNRCFDTLERAGIAFIPLKGAVIRDLYPEPWMRTSGDIDILVGEADLDRAVAALSQELSYRTDGGRNYHDVLLVAPSGVHVELHFSIQENMERMDALLSRVWDYARPVTEYRYALTNEFLAFHLIAHMAYHFSGGGCGIRPLMDVFLLMGRGVVDEAVLRGYLARCGLEAFYDHVLALIAVWFEDGTPTPITQSMERFILDGGTYGSSIQKLAVSREHEGGTMGYLLGRIFMPLDAMKKKYPVLQRYPILLPVMQVWRWIRLFSGGRLGRAAGEVRRCGQIGKARSEEVSLLLRQLGL